MQAASSFALGVSLDYLGGQGKTKATGFLRSSEALVLNTAARPRIWRTDMLMKQGPYSTSRDPEMSQDILGLISNCLSNPPHKLTSVYI